MLGDFKLPDFEIVFVKTGRKGILGCRDFGSVVWICSPCKQRGDLQVLSITRQQCLSRQGQRCQQTPLQHSSCEQRAVELVHVPLVILMPDSSLGYKNSVATGFWP